MKTINDVISDFMAKRCVKDEHFITPFQWKEIAVLFAKEACETQKFLCAEALITDEILINPVQYRLDVLDAKSPV